MTNMKIKISSRFKQLISCNVSRSEIPTSPPPPPINEVLDLREEYANAFRTESYNDFWTRVLALSDGHGHSTAMSSATAAARLPSYRLFAEHLLDPDQPTVTRILTTLSHTNTISTKCHALFSDYFAETANASLVCGSFLKDIDRVRVKYRALRATLDDQSSFETASHENHLSVILTRRLTDFSNSFNPFMIITSSPDPSSSSSSSFSSPRRLQLVQVGCSDLLKRLELNRVKAHAKLRFIKKLKFGSAISLVALTVTLTVIVVTHALAALVAAPGLLMASMEQLIAGKKLAKLSAQLDIAAKGTYILSRDLDTISRLVARLSDELEHMRTTAKFWLKRRRTRTDHDKAAIQTVVEVARQLQKNDSSFSQQLDELEEHLYLCFMTINRARNLVIKEIV